MMQTQKWTTLTLAATLLLGSCGGGGGSEVSVTSGPVGGACLASATGDTGAHAPPAGGPYAYSPPGSWLPGTAGFPALGSSYVDPVFGTTLRRITDEPPRQSSSDIYASNGWWNADSTLFVQNTGATTGFGRVAINVETGAFVQTNVPDGTAQVLHSFDPVDPDVWHYYQNAELRQFSITRGTDTPVTSFPAEVEKLGGSVDWIDRSGRYFLVAYNAKLHVWDRMTPTLYTGEIDFPAGAGWAGISPDGKYVITAIRNQNIPSTVDFTSYEINHTTTSLPATGIMFWNLCGDHGDLVTASDGKTYLVTFECYDEGAVYRVDVTIPHTGPAESDRQKQRIDNVMLFDTDWPETSGHFSCVSSGPNKDWCFLSIESADDTFASQGTWRPYKQEIIAVQVVPPFAVRRLAHHRSRSIDCPSCTNGGYSHQPRVSASWDGRRIAFASNFGHDASPDEYADIYVLDPNCAP
jgi:hypothetical protein